MEIPQIDEEITGPDLLALRSQAGLSREELAEALGYGRTRELELYEAGVQPVSRMFVTRWNGKLANGALYQKHQVSRKRLTFTSQPDAYLYLEAQINLLALERHERDFIRKLLDLLDDFEKHKPEQGNVS